jgi:predicted nucleotidyltransferase
LNSSVLKWPSIEIVHNAAKRWSERIAYEKPEILRIGYFGSYAKGNFGVGSDLDLLILIHHAQQPFERRGATLDLSELPVPADLHIYSIAEWNSMDKTSRFYQTLSKETVWIYTRET